MFIELAENSLQVYNKYRELGIDGLTFLNDLQSILLMLIYKLTKCKVQCGKYL